MYRKYEPTKFDGEKVEFKTIAQRRALIGKRVGYDTTYSTYAHYGVVTDTNRTEICVDNSWVYVSQIEQIVVLNQQ